MHKNLLRGLTGLLLTVATSASAANLEGSFSVTPIIGGYTFDNKQHLDTNLVFGGRVGYNFTKAIGIEALMDYLETDQKNGPIKGLSMYRYGGELLYHFIPDSTFVPYVAVGFAGLNFDGDNKRSTRGAFDYGVGAKYFLNDRFALRTDVRHIMYTYDKTYNNLEYTIGAYIPFGGVSPAAKPVEPVPEEVVAKPVPVTPPATVAEPKKPPVVTLSAAPQTITKGQSATLSWSSSEAFDCGIQPAIAQVKTSTSVGLQGDLRIAPEESSTYTLTCRGEGGSSSSTARITVNLPPQAVPAVEPVNKTTQPLLRTPPTINVLFNFNKASIKPRYKDELNKLGEFLKTNPTATVTIEGYTDNVGSRKVNQKLSTRRAEAGRSYIIRNFGIDGNRISIKGFGLSKPVASNKTRKGRALNRRVQTRSTTK